MNSVRTQLNTLIAEQLNIGVDQIVTLHRLDELGIDSLDMIDMIGLVEAHFSIRIPNETIDSMQTIDDLANAVEATLPNHA